EGLQTRVGGGPQHDDVRIAAHHPRGVLDALAPADLAVAGGDGADRPAEPEHRRLERQAGARRVLLEEADQVAPRQRGDALLGGAHGLEGGRPLQEPLGGVGRKVVQLQVMTDHDGASPGDRGFSRDGRKRPALSPGPGVVPAPWSATAGPTMPGDCGVAQIASPARRWNSEERLGTSAALRRAAAATSERASSCARTDPGPVPPAFALRSTLRRTCAASNTVSSNSGW